MQQSCVEMDLFLSPGYMVGVGGLGQTLLMDVCRDDLQFAVWKSLVFSRHLGYICPAR